MFITPKIVLTLFAVLFQNTQVPQQDAQSNVSDPSRQYSVLQRIETGTIDSQSVTRVAQLPQDWEPTKSSRRVLGRLPAERDATRGDFNKQPQFQLQLSGADLVQAGELQTFKIRLDNQWPSDSHVVRLQLGMPPGFLFADSDLQAKFDPNRQVVAWELDSVPASSAIEINFRARAVGQGPQLHQISVIQDRTVKTVQQLETFVLLGKQMANQLPTRQLPSQTFPRQQTNSPMVARELPPIVQSDNVIVPAMPLPERILRPSQGPPLPIYRR